MLDNILQDLRLSFRALRRVPIMSGVAILTVAIGIAVVTCVFSLVNAAFYKSLPFTDSGRIVALTSFGPKLSAFWSQQPLQIVEAVRHNAWTFDRVAAFSEDPYASFTDKFGATQAGVTAIDSSAAPLLGLHPEAGRLFTPAELASHASVAIISDSLWRSRYGGPSSPLGDAITIKGISYTIVGVLPPSVLFYERSHILIPLDERPDSLAPGDGKQYGLIGHIRHGVTMAAVRADVQATISHLGSDDHIFRQWSMRVQNGMFDRGSDRPQNQILAWALIGVTMCILLIACTNVSNLLLVRAAERRHELVVRAALGASQARLARTLLAESLIIGIAGGTLAIVLAVWLEALVVSMAPPYLPTWVHFGVDWHVIAFTIAISLVAVAAIGTPSVREGTNVGLGSALKAGGQGTVTNRGVMKAARRGVIVELALSATLFVAAALLYRSYGNASHVEYGYPAEQIRTTFVRFDKDRYPDGPSKNRFLYQVAERLARDPRVGGVAIKTGVTILAVDEATAKSAAAGSKRSAADNEWGRPIYTPEGGNAEAALSGAPGFSERFAISDNYFEVMGQRFLAGSGFDASVQRGSEAVAVITSEFGRIVWPGHNPVGQTFRIGKSGSLIRVIGVVSDVRAIISRGSKMEAPPAPDVYLSERQAKQANWQLLVRDGHAAALPSSAIIGAVKDTDSEVITDGPRSLGSIISAGARVITIMGSMIGVLAVCGLLLAMMGIFAVIAYGVSQRTREIGLRLALGATPTDLMRYFIFDGMKPVARGLAIGFVLALAASQLLRSMLMGVSPFDFVSYASVAAIFGVVALLACWIPARRVMRVDPMVALRDE